MVNFFSTCKFNYNSQYFIIYLSFFYLPADSRRGEANYVLMNVKKQWQLLTGTKIAYIFAISF